jgi:type IV pilus assembly protein PilP
MKTLAFSLALTVASVTALGAQAPVTAPPPVAVAPAPDLPAPPADYTYSPGGRRDPFTSLTTRSGPIVAPAPGTAPKGAAGISVDELNVKGIVRSNGSYVAMVSGASGNRQTYTVKPGSRLFDGTVQSITADAVVILQQVSDPLSLQKQRQVRKPLRTQEEGK